MRKIAIFALSLVVFFGLAFSYAQAIEFMHPTPDDRGSVTVPSSDTHKNLYVAGGSATVDGTTTKDLFVAGGTVVVNGAVGQDLFAAGGTVTVNSSVGSNASVAGGTITINSPIAGDLLVAGGTVTLGEKAVVSGDLTLGGGTLTVNAPVLGSVRIAGGSIYINSKIDGNVYVRSTDQLTFGPKAEVSHTVDYTGKNPAVIKDGAKVGQIDYKKLEVASKKTVRGIVAGGFVIQLLAWILAGLLLARFFGRRALVISEDIYKNPWATLGIGFLGLIVTPIIAVVLLIVLVGYYVAGAVILSYLLFLMFAAIMAALFLGALIVKWLTKKPDLAVDWQAVLIGVVVLRLISFIPIVGWLVCAVLFLMTFGALLKMAKHEIASNNS